ncbi:MAG: hypothetical protein ABI870_03365 [Rhodanobacter sp.]
MATPRKIVLHSLQGYRAELDAIVIQWIQERIKYVGIVGVDTSLIEDIIDELCVGDGSSSYFMVTVETSNALVDTLIYHFSVRPNSSKEGLQNANSR